MTASPPGPNLSRGAPLKETAQSPKRRTHRGVTVGAGRQAVQDAIGSTPALAQRRRMDPIVSYRTRRGKGTLAGMGDHSDCLQDKRSYEVKKIILAVAVAAVATMALVGSASAGPPGITATPAASKTWAGHTATFVRSTSGIINETNRVNLDPAGPQNPWTSADVYLQFRPTTGPSGTGSPTANPACDPNGLVRATFPFVNTDAHRSAEHRLRVTSSERTRTTCASIWSTRRWRLERSIQPCRRYDD